MGARILRSSFWLSIVVHTFVFVVCAVLLRKQDTMPSRRQSWIQITPVVMSKSQIKNEKQRFDSSQKQVVLTEKGLLVDRPAPNSLLGERNQMVTEQTVGKTQVFKEARQHSRPMLQAQSQNQKISRELSFPSLKGLGLPIVNHLRKKQEEDQILTPEGDARWVEEGVRVQDYVKGIKEASQTSLNTREYVFYGYFTRIRERLDRAWVPILRKQLVKYHYSGRSLASNTDHSTRLIVVLNQKGEVTRVQITSESGTRDLDEAAIRAFNEAGPFPNPPKGMIDQNGEIEIPWEFILRT